MARPKKAGLDEQIEEKDIEVAEKPSTSDAVKGIREGKKPKYQ